MTSGYDDAYLAGLYDHLNPWGRDNDFYLALVRAADAVLDVGCGTGALLRRARADGHRGRLVGLDPAEAMLDQARAGTDVEWVHGDLTTTAWEGAFDLAVMTGHAFQELLTDEEITTSLTALRRALVPDGVFAFETRNPAARAWESWHPGNAVDTSDGDGAPLTLTQRAEPPTAAGLVSLTTTVTGPSLANPRRYHGHLRFTTADELDTLLARAGLAAAERFGGWDRTPWTPDAAEIITLAHPREAVA